MTSAPCSSPTDVRKVCGGANGNPRLFQPLITVPIHKVLTQTMVPLVTSHYWLGLKTNWIRTWQEEGSFVATGQTEEVTHPGCVMWRQRHFDLPSLKAKTKWLLWLYPAVVLCKCKDLYISANYKVWWLMTQLWTGYKLKPFTAKWLWPIVSIELTLARSLQFTLFL